MTNQPTALHGPTPVATDGERITLAHGEGGRLMRRLLEERIFPALGNATRNEITDAAVLPNLEASSAFTTDSFVVSPLFFPGGDIGKLCVFGTVNDLAVAGAVPLWISLSLIIEEGLPLAVLDAVLESVAAAAREADVTVEAGDTKVVPRGTADSLFVNTAGIGKMACFAPPGPKRLQPGVELLVSGSIGRHGMAVMAAREQFDIRPCPTSDCASLVPVVEALRRAEVPVVALRDATRGGVAAVLHEWAASCGHTMAIEEERVPVACEVRAMCELMGLDPLHVANEGTMVLAVATGAGRPALEALRAVPVSQGAEMIGHVRPRALSPVIVQRGLGRYVPLDEPLGAPLPRIC